MEGDGWDEDDQTIVDDTPLVDSGAITPIDVEACHLCGAVCVIDAFTQEGLEAFPEHCIRAKDGHFWWCSKFRETNKF